MTLTSLFRNTSIAELTRRIYRLTPFDASTRHVIIYSSDSDDEARGVSGDEEALGLPASLLRLLLGEPLGVHVV